MTPTPPVVFVKVMLVNVIVIVPVVVLVSIRQVHIELYTLNAGLFLASDVEVIAVELQLFQLAFQLARVNAQTYQRADEHITTDAAKNVEVKKLHFIWGTTCTCPMWSL